MRVGHRQIFYIPRRPVQAERKKENGQGRDGRTARRHHTGILRRGVWCASRRPPLGVRLPSSYLSSQSLSDSRFNLRATSRSPPSRRALPCRFFLCRVALLCLVLRRRRRLPFPCSLGFFRLSAQRRPPCCISWPLESIELSSSKGESSDAHCYHLPPSHIIAQVHSLFEHLCLHGLMPALGSSPSGAS